MPNGTDYIVLSHKQIELPQIDGVETQDTIWMNLSEDETLMMRMLINLITNAVQIQTI